MLDILCVLLVIFAVFVTTANLWAEILQALVIILFFLAMLNGFFIIARWCLS